MTTPAFFLATVLNTQKGFPLLLKLRLQCLAYFLELAVFKTLAV